MDIKIGDIVNNLISTEPAVITKTQNLGTMTSVTYIGKITSKSSTKVLSSEDINKLEILSEDGKFNFKGNPERFLLYAEAERINTAYQYDPLFAVNCSIVEPLPHQVEAVYKFLLPLPKIRFLLADDTGAGKTIMTGLLMKELMMRGTIERILVITPGGLTKQWQEDEMLVKFNTSFTLVNRAIFNSDPNVFISHDKIITSIDFISREEILKVASNPSWDLIIFDEAHKLSAYDYGSKVYKAKRYEAAEKLSKQTEHLLLLTATPHRGRKDTFRKLLQLLDEDIFSTEEVVAKRIKEVENNGVNKFFIRRLKEDMKDWDGKPLYKNRFTKTVAYEITEEEKRLYDEVTGYLVKKKEEAIETKNIHVSLALTVMQRRLASSIFAIKNTLERRYKALNAITEELKRNPGLWKQKQKIEEIDIENIDEYDDLDEDERTSFENIFSDPRKYRLFTTAKNQNEIFQEAAEVKRLYDIAENLYKRNQEEKKYKELNELLKSQGVLDGEKLVIFTEHRDTLIYLETRLKNNGYEIATIHGGKTVDERREAQFKFANKETQILIATDAAGEGINLQFCRLMINWDIPWNPNRLEQRMGRIHRYGQKQDVLVFNMVANNTKEGQVLKRLLDKLDIIRESIGDDRVYDVIQDVLDDVSLEDIIDSVFNGKDTALSDFILMDNETLKAKFAQKIKESKEKFIHLPVDYKDARLLKDNSDEKRLQPIYIRMFFEKAFKHFGGEFTENRSNVYKIEKFPGKLAELIKNNYKINPESIKDVLFCFDKQIFLEYQYEGNSRIHYINPGNIVFDSLLKLVINKCKEDVIKGTILVSPDDLQEQFAFLVKSQIVDNRTTKKAENTADESINLILTDNKNKYSITSPAKFIDLFPPTSFAKEIEPPELAEQDKVVEWCFNNITLKQLDETKKSVVNDCSKRKEHLETAFTQTILDLQKEIQEHQGKLLVGDKKAGENITRIQQRINETVERKRKRLTELDLMMELTPKSPEVLGCAYIIPLTKMEYENNFGMSRDDEAERTAMEVSMKYEKDNGWNPTDVSKDNVGFDIRSENSNGIKRYIEVKGRSGEGGVMLTENEMQRLTQLGESAWLYIVINCKSKPQINRIQNPASKLIFEEKSKGVQYFVDIKVWKKAVDNL